MISLLQIRNKISFDRTGEEPMSEEQATPESQEATPAIPKVIDAPEAVAESAPVETLKPSGKTPLWPGITGGLLPSLTEKYLITWTSPKQQVFEVPTGGAATMLSGENALYFAKKEQALALGRHLRTFKIFDYKVWREFANGDQVYLHPKDGVFPEKVNAGRAIVNSVARKIGDNPNPIKVKFTGKQTYEV